MEKEKFIPKKEEEIKFVAISDFQGAPTEEVLEKIPEKDVDLYIQTGDLALTKIEQELIKKVKSFSGEEIENLKKDPLFKEHLEKRKRVDIAYLRYLREKNPELKQKILEETKREHQELIERLKEKCGNKFIHIWGNYDQRNPEHQKIVREVLRDYEISSYTIPHYEEIGKETAMIFWPFQKPPKEKEGQEEFKKKLLEWSKELREKIKNKSNVIIFGHEHIFRGPQEEVYKERIEKAGFKRPTRTPRNQPNPSAKYIMNVFKGLSPEAQGMYVFGHLHFPEKQLEKGITYFHEKEGKIPMRVFGLGEKLPKEYKRWKGRKTIDLVYVPQGMIAKIRIKKEKIRVEKK